MPRKNQLVILVLLLLLFDLVFAFVRHNQAFTDNIFYNNNIMLRRAALQAAFQRSLPPSRIPSSSSSRLLLPRVISFYVPPTATATTSSRHGTRLYLSAISNATVLDETDFTNQNIDPEKVIPLSKTKTNSQNEKSNNNNLNKNKNDSEDDLELYLQGLTSRPVPNGMWNPKDPLDWAKDFGSRSQQDWERLQPLVQLKPGDEGYFDSSDLKVPGVTIVRTKEQAKIVLEKLMNADPTTLHACDTEVMDIDLKEVGPVGNGYVTCASVYSGPNFDYGLGDPPGTTLWIDNLDDAYGVLQEFKPFFENERALKVWHNYGFDRHVMFNEGINVKGFGGDTMHMARLQDTSRGMPLPQPRRKPKPSVPDQNSNNEAQEDQTEPVKLGYSLEALTSELLNRRKRPMKEIFGVNRKRKDGTDGLIIDVPPIEVLQRDPRFRYNFILYSCYDAEGTWLLQQKLQQLLEKTKWENGYEYNEEGKLTNVANLFDYYWHYMREFGSVLTDMERRGIRVNANEYLASVEIRARQDRRQHEENFRQWAAKIIGIDGLALNPASSTQLATFLFGGAANPKTKEKSETVRVFKVAREEIPQVALDAYQKRDEAQKLALKRNKSTTKSAPEPDELDELKATQLKVLCKEKGLKVSGKKDELKERLRGHLLAPPSNDENENMDDDYDSMNDNDLKDVLVARGLPILETREERLNTLRQDTEFAREIVSKTLPTGRDGYATISDALERFAEDSTVAKEILDTLNQKPESKFVNVTIESVGMTPEKYTAAGSASVTADVLRKLAGDPFADPPKYGTAKDFFDDRGFDGHEACVALHSLCSIGSIDTMIANFLTSLQSLADHQSRVHCSLNLNTETGRLSSRRPNLQNQPALEKDKYQIRKAFESSPGNNLIVADYGQLELRLLASMTQCKSMIDAFKSGGDFHSRTALDMFDYVQEKVNSGEVLLEWDYSKGDPPKPLLKDEFAAERRKAKTLNFSIAYGKTAHGLSQDWGVSKEEAQEMLDKWYDARPEVRDWQTKTKQIAKEYGITRTLMGRYRKLPGALASSPKSMQGHAERASINTPIQGGAADIAMMAMNKINNSEKLKRLGWILLMQIHDEVILEGPEETSSEAFEEVIKCMEAPWVPGLHETSVPLLVDGSHTHKTWYDAK